MYIYDTTLRDGSQAEGISYTVEDKIKIIKKLDRFGINYIEAGNPGSNPKDIELFERLKHLKLAHAKISAFGSSRRADISVYDDENVKALINAGTEAVAIFGKCWDFHVTDIIKTTLEENLRMISDTVRYLKENVKEVIFDAEHFFDGYKNNKEYAIESITAAVKAGADCVALCDTNGGTLPMEIYDIVSELKRSITCSIGIHCHNDGGAAEANSLLAVSAGALQVQGTINGYGERCGNANLCTIVPNLQLKMNRYCVPEENIKDITFISRYISEITNKAPLENAPFVGNSAFAHKGGMHIDAVIKDSRSFEHVSPDLVGNERRILMSEVSGRSTLMSTIKREIPWATKDSPEVRKIIEKLKQLEYEGYQFEGAESSFELLIKRSLGRASKFFELIDFRVIDDNFQKKYSSLAVIKVMVDGVQEMTVSEGDGPVNALDKALRKALEIFYPNLSAMRLLDYKVRVLNTSEATGSKVRVHIESTDGDKVWGTVGVSTNIIEASLTALIDSIEYFLYSEKEKIILDEIAE